MNITDFLIACIPILSWGFVPVIATLIGGKVIEQSFGIAIGSFIFACIIYAIKHPSLNLHIIGIGIVSGLFWTIGSVGQFMGLKYLGVSKSMPISNGTQIIGTSILGVFLGDWSTLNSKIFGFSALALIILGIIFTSYKEVIENDDAKKINWSKGISVNLLSSLGFTLYVGILKYYNIDSWSSLLPQSVGQLIGINIIAFLYFKVNPYSLNSLKNSVVGVVWAIGNLAILISQMKLGLSVAYPVGQASIIVSVIAGVYFNEERKTKKEWISSIIGMTVIVVGLFFIYLSGVFDKS
ncbi:MULTISPECIES: GRP family sugar transporter [Apibacter]|uniref:GRP family sugar transporter n=1 Tax=Apibacter TaxID=1778601 RepID=UPI001C69D534|nr:MULTISPECIES: GRP family sugar transporter [Apibacter]QYN51213.1 glucose transporter GlcU [Apibacter sp. ESL0404]